MAVNDLGDIKTLAHLFKFDSAFGIYHRQVEAKENGIAIDGKLVQFFSQKDPAQLPWGDLGVDVVIESTGVFLTQDSAAAHLKGGARKVVISAPAKGDDVPTYVMGVNHQEYKGETVVSNASCTTNCIAPIMKVIQDAMGIQKSLMTTIHSYTADQVLVDGPHKDLRRARAAALNIVPTTTGAAKATGKVIPAIEGKFDGLSIRVPSPVVSLSDITVLTGRVTSNEEINNLLIEAGQKTFQGIIETSDAPLVSTDLIGSPSSAIVDLSLTQTMDGDLVKVVAWYDNEWGYSNRLVEMSQLVGNYRG
ncbi:MAG: Glyceraldehyde-3-phosphate dehydrogenase [bacterium ADurb.Bin400]|nr:MAG: Glyceraldehyde-3-phosphate dehydrogenase [bacterium ADurb.Bin400]